jgi:hypothetical protein
MKLIFLLIFSFLIIQGCGKKSDPQYQGKVYSSFLSKLS